MWATCRSPLIVVVSPALSSVRASGCTFGATGKSDRKSWVRCARVFGARRRTRVREIAIEDRSRKNRLGPGGKPPGNVEPRHVPPQPHTRLGTHLGQKEYTFERTFSRNARKRDRFLRILQTGPQSSTECKWEYFRSSLDFFLHLECARRGLSHRTTASARPETQSTASTCPAGRSF